MEQICPITDLTTSLSLSIEGEIGHGGYAKVHRGRYQDKSVAVKLTCSSDSKHNYNIAGVCSPAEIDIMRRFNHPHLLRMIDFVMPEQCGFDGIAIIMPLFPYSLVKYAKSSYYSYGLKNIYQIATALDFLHKNSILHLDVKPDNVLIDRDGNAILADFGLCSYMVDGVLTRKYAKGTPKYIAPELWLGKEYTAKADVWSLGITMMEILATYPFNTSMMARYNLKKEYLEIARMISKSDSYRRRFLMDKFVSADFIDLLYHMLDPNPVTRYSITQVLENPLFLKYREVIDAKVSELIVSFDSLVIEYIPVIVDLCTKNENRAEVLFLAIDLLYCSSKFELDNISAIACYKLALGLLIRTVTLDDLVKLTNKTLEELRTVLSREREIVQFLDGILYRPYIFAKCETVEQLKLAFQELVLHPEQYGNLDLWLTENPPIGKRKAYRTETKEIL